MALGVNFTVQKELEEAVATFKGSDSQRALLAVVEDEIIKLQTGPTPRTSDFEADLTGVRKAFKDEGLVAAFFIVALPEPQNFVLVMMVPDIARPKVKMIYASAVSRLRDLFKLEKDLHITSVDALRASLFAAQNERELMTDKERVYEEIGKMAIAPQQMQALPVGSLSTNLSAAIEGLKCNEHRSIACVVGANGVELEKTLNSSASDSEVVDSLPTDAPRFLVLRWKQPDAEEPVFVLAYLCPGTCKPRERMMYAATKQSFANQVTGNGIVLAKSVEVDGPGELLERIKESLMPINEEQYKRVAAPKPMAKGPRMLLPMQK